MATTDPTLNRDAFSERTFQPTLASRLSPFEAIRRSLVLVLIPVVLLVGAAAAVALVRKPTYTSEARLNVGGLTLTQESIQGYTTAVQYLAIAYARAIDATNVVLPVARELRLSPEVVAQQVSATPIPGSPVLAVDATSKDPRQAVRLANATSNSLVRYAIRLNSGIAASQQLRARYVGASRALQRAIASLQQAPPRTAQQRAAQTRVDIARLETQTDGALYEQSRAGQATENLVQKLAPAAPPTNDRSSILQQFAAGGLLAGLLIGVGLAMWRANGLALRRLREP